MEPNEVDYITKVGSQLITLITWNTMIVAQLRASDTLSQPDLAILESIPNLNDRIFKFLEILKTKPNGYRLLTESLKEVKQGGAVNLLEQIPPRVIIAQKNQTSSNVAVQQSTPQSCSGKGQYNLNFGDCEILNEVMPNVRADLVSKMNSEDANTMIISQLASLNYFDHSEIENLITGEHKTQNKRMLDLFSKMANLDNSEILDCFNKLCNLNDHPKASERFRKIFQKHFPECL